MGHQDGQARHGPVPRPLGVFTAVPRAPGRGGLQEPSPTLILAPLPACGQLHWRHRVRVLERAPRRSATFLYVRGRQHLKSLKIGREQNWEGARAAASEAGRDGETLFFFVSQRRCAAPARGAGRPIGRGRPTHIRLSDRPRVPAPRHDPCAARNLGAPEGTYTYVNTLGRHASRLAARISARATAKPPFFPFCYTFFVFFFLTLFGNKGRTQRQYCPEPTVPSKRLDATSRLLY